ncbi:HIT family protein [Lactobacillus psittaci]|uniref:Histidine triad HIT family protein n=1 Tax=Lactobacillus psittaci DSM 15354 TaxID=1122152 RepID=A0A0R1S6M5_9LACO|nr:HIT family protein [Lactobacillus psittaci]KRL61896.1 histidine triad HIT family protein [Lactobacillus psittaci DSM 15354]
MNQLDDNCLFCKIIKGEVPSYKVFENDDVYAFLDISQVNPGHTLMVPKKHIINFFDYSQEDAAKYLQYIPVIAKAIKKADPRITGMNVGVNNGASADQIVMHSHVHLIPRFENDGFKIATRNNADDYTPEKYEAIASAIRKQF